MDTSSYQGNNTTNNTSTSNKRSGRRVYASQSPTQHSVPINPRRKFRRRGTGDSATRHDAHTDDEMQSSASESEELELDAVSSDVEYDEETGLTGEEQRKHQQQKRRRNRLDARIAGETTALSKEEQRAADKHVVRKLVINAVLIALWYFFSLSISIYNKWMFSGDHLNFHYPLFTTSVHMLVQFLLASMILLIFPSLRPRQKPPQTLDGLDPSKPRKPLLTPLFYFTRLVPTGTATSLDIGLGNDSLRYITLTFYTMCKSSVLIFVLMFAFLFRLERPSWRLILIILSMTVGVLMMVFGETAFNALGFTLAITASFFSGIRWALTQILLLRHPATSNPFATLFLLAPIMFTTLFVIANISETPAAVIAGLNTLVAKEGLATAILLMFIPGMLAFCMISAEFTLLQRTNVVTLSICGIFKEVVTISAAGIIFHDELSAVNVSGLLVTIISIACYNYLKVTKMRDEARERLAKKVDDLDADEDEDVRAGSRREGAFSTRRRRKSHGASVSHGGGGGPVAPRDESLSTTSVPEDASVPLMGESEQQQQQQTPQKAVDTSTRRYS